MTGKLPADLASGVIAPRYRTDERPPRTLPWKDVQQILHSISRREAPGRRDFAIVLLLATYGLGAAEVLAIRLEDLDWRAGVLRVRRPKTKVSIELPLLPAVAKALTAYLRWERPPAKSVHSLFLPKNMPYEPITSAAIRYLIRHYARLAGVSAKVIGAHAFRHSHASRQIDSGANVKVVSDILGHRSSSSTSVYVRVALKRSSGCGPPGAAMNNIFQGPVAGELHAFLQFKRSLGYGYMRAEFTLREFDRFLIEYAARNRYWKLDRAAIAWLSSKPGRKPISVSADAAVLRQFYRYLRRSSEPGTIAEPIWPHLPTESSFLPFSLSEKDVLHLLTLCADLKRPPFRAALYRAMILVLYCTGIRFGEALRLRMETWIRDPPFSL
jgi:integrase